MTLDELIHGFGDEVLTAARRFAQGDVLRGVPVGFYAVGAHAITTVGKLADGTTVEFVGADDVEFECGVITTQTCDVVEEDSKHPRKPWIQVSPVYKYDNLREDQARAIESYSMPDLARLTGAQFEDGFYVADLRLSIPLEKSVLVGRDPIKGFASESDLEGFAEHFAAYIVRPALSAMVNERVVKHINRYFERKAPEREILRAAGVSAFRLRVAGDDANPIVQVIVVLSDRTTEKVALAGPVCEAWLAVARGAAASAKAAITFLTLQIESMHTMSAFDFDSTVPLRSDNIL